MYRNARGGGEQRQLLEAAANQSRHWPQHQVQGLRDPLLGPELTLWCLDYGEVLLGVEKVSGPSGGTQETLSPWNQSSVSMHPTSIRSTNQQSNTPAWKGVTCYEYVQTCFSCLSYLTTQNNSSSTYSVLDIVNTLYLEKMQGMSRICIDYMQIPSHFI